MNWLDSVIYLRTYVEASIDFPDEEIDFLADGKIESKLTWYYKSVGRCYALKLNKVLFYVKE